MKSQKIKAIAYYRSVGHQIFEVKPADAGQREAVEKYAEENNLKLEKEFATCSTRYAKKELQRALFYCQRNPKIKLLLIKSYDRISRNLVEYTIWRKAFKDCGVEVISITQPTDDSPMGKFMEAIYVGMSTHDRNVRAEKVKDSLRRKKVQEG